MHAGSGGGTVLAEFVEGVALGIVIPVAAIWIERLPIFGAAGAYECLNPFAIALTVYAESPSATVRIDMYTNVYTP